MAPRWKTGWIKAAFILLATLPLAAAITDPKIAALDPPEEAYISDRYWIPHDPSENAPSRREGVSYTLIENSTVALVGGGCDDKRAYDTLHLYNIATGSWQPMGQNMSVLRSNFQMVTFNNDVKKDLVVIIGGDYEHLMNHVEAIDMVEKNIFEPTISGIEIPWLWSGGSTTWKDLLVLYGGLHAQGNTGFMEFTKDIYVLNVTSWTWSMPTLTGDPLPIAEHANMVLVPNWNGRDTVFIYSNSWKVGEDSEFPFPGEQNDCVFALDPETWSVTTYVTDTPGPIGQYGSSTSQVSIDPYGNRYIYHYGGGFLLDNGERVYSSELFVLMFGEVPNWVFVPVRPDPKSKGSWMGILIGGLPQNMPAYIGEEPLVYMLGGHIDQSFDTKEIQLKLGGSSPVESMVSRPTVHGSPVLDFFQVHAGDIIQFTVDPRNALGEPFPYGGDDIYGWTKQTESGRRKLCEKSESDATPLYIMSCQVRTYGNYTFSVEFRYLGPFDLPYQALVLPASVSVAHSIAEGHGMKEANAGEVAVYETKLYDVYGNRASVVSEDVRVAALVGCNGNATLAEAEMFDDSSFEPVEAIVTLDDPVSSLYTIEYIPKTSGVCKVQNMVNGSPLGNITYVVVKDPPPPPGYIALASGEGATFMVLNILSCLAACAASFYIFFRAEGGYRDGFVFSSGALALISSLLYIGEPQNASCQARSAIGLMAFGMLTGVMLSQTLWYLGYYRTPILAVRLPISPKRALKYAGAAVCFEGLLIIILQTTAPIRRSIFTVKGDTYIGCSDASGNNILYLHLALLCFLSVISFMTRAHKSPDIATSINSIIAYNLTVLAFFLVGLIEILQNKDMKIFFVLQSLDIWFACMLTFGLVIYSKVKTKGNIPTETMKNILAESGGIQTLVVGTAVTTESSRSGTSRRMALAHPHLRQDGLTKTTWKKCIYLHPRDFAYGVIYYDFHKPGISLENMEDVTPFENNESGLRYGLRVKVREEEKVLAFAKETDRAEYLEALNIPSKHG